MIDVRARLEGVLGASQVETWRGPGAARELPCALPRDVEQAAELVRLAGREGLALVPLGAGTKLGETAPPERVDFMLSTRHLAGVLSHEPADGTVAARAGTPMDVLARVVQEGGHWLTPDVPRPASSTLGGVLAAGQSGSDRLRFGPSRDHVLGMTVLLADGAVTRTGGQLVKNVTGYDLHRLYWGSHGTLCVILEAALRLFPLPEERIVLVQEYAARGEALAGARSVLAATPRAWSVRVDERRGEPRPWSLFVQVAGKREAARREAAAVQRVLGAARALVGDDAHAFAEGVRDRTRPEEAARLAVGCRPSRVERVLDELDRTAPAAGFALELALEPALARVEASVTPVPAPGGAPSDLAAFVRDLRDGLREARATVRVERAPAEVMRAVDPFGLPAPGLDLMRRLRAAIDPTGVFATGRFHGGL